MFSLHTLISESMQYQKSSFLNIKKTGKKISACRSFGNSFYIILRKKELTFKILQSPFTGPGYKGYQVLWNIEHEKKNTHKTSEESAYEFGHVQSEVVLQGHGVDADVGVTLHHPLLLVRRKNRQDLLHPVQFLVTERRHHVISLLQL